MTLDQSRSERRRRVLETTLIESHQDIFRFLVRKLRNEADAKDVIQEFYVKALTRFDDLKDEDRLRGWLSQILRSTIADFFRARARTRKALGTYYADLIWRVDLLGEDRSAIADDLGLTDNGLRVKLHRARRAMRDRLEQTCLTCVEHGYFRCACPGAEGLRKHGPVKRPAGRAGPDRASPVEP